MTCAYIIKYNVVINEYFSYQNSSKIKLYNHSPIIKRFLCHSRKIISSCLYIPLNIFLQ